MTGNVIHITALFYSRLYTDLICTEDIRRGVEKKLHHLHLSRCASDSDNKPPYVGFLNNGKSGFCDGICSG